MRSHNCRVESGEDESTVMAWGAIPCVKAVPHAISEALIMPSTTEGCRHFKDFPTWSVRRGKGKTRVQNVYQQGPAPVPPCQFEERRTCEHF